MALKFDLKVPIFKFIGLLIFLFLLKYVDWDLYLDLLKHSNPVLILLLVPMLLFQIWLKVIRWKKFLDISNTHYLGKMKELFQYYMAGLYFSVYSPGRIGDLLKFNYLRSENPYSAFFITLIDRLCDLLVLLIMGAFSLLFTFKDEFFNIYGIIGIFIATPLIIYIVYKYIPVILKKFIPGKREFDLSSVLNINNWKALSEIILLSFFSILFFYFRVYIGAYALNLNLSYFSVFLVCSAVSIAVLLPTFAGFGARESVVWLYFMRFGLNSANALIFSNLMLFITLIDGFAGFIVFLIIPNGEKIKEEALEEIDEGIQDIKG